MEDARVDSSTSENPTVTASERSGIFSFRLLVLAKETSMAGPCGVEVKLSHILTRLYEALYLDLRSRRPTTRFSERARFGALAGFPPEVA